MSIVKNNKVKKILQIILWSLLGIGLIVLMTVALMKKEAGVCTGFQVELTGTSEHFFLDKKEIAEIVSKVNGNQLKGTPVREIDLMKMEQLLKKNPWVKSAELYFDKDGILMVSIEERIPVARIFCNSGQSYYIDEELNMLPISSSHTAMLPMVTGFPTDNKVLSKPDSLLIGEAATLCKWLAKDSFLMAMTDQVNINVSRKFELVPKMGDQLIVLGDMENMSAKLNNLKLFYKKVISRKGLAKYKKIDVQYNGQVVATIRDAADIAADSIRTMELVSMMADMTAKKAGDTTHSIIADNDRNSVDVSLINQSFQREELEEQNTDVAVTATAPNTKQQTPSAKQQTPSTKQQTPSAKQQAPNARRQTPNTKQQTPNAKRQTPNNKPQTKNNKPKNDY